MNAYSRIVINLTNKCNTVCHYCFQDSRPSKNQFLSLKKVRECLDWCVIRADSKLFIQFTGGEPTIHPKFWKIFEYAKNKGCVIKLQTNGLTLKQMSAEQLGLLSQKEVAVKISLDGYNQETHEKLRAKGTFSRIMAGVEALIPYNPRFAFKSVLSSQVATEFQKMLDLSLSVGAVGISYNFLRPEGRASNLRNEIDEYEFTKRAIELFNQRKYRHLLNGTRILEIWMFPQKGFGNKHFFINYDGLVYPTQKYEPDECIGNINSNIECLNENRLKTQFREIPLRLFRLVKNKLKIQGINAM